MALFVEIFGLGPIEIGVIGALAILLFGRKLPDVGHYLGKSITEFRNAMRDSHDAPGGKKGSGDSRNDDDNPGEAGVFARLKPKPPTLPGHAQGPG